MAIKTCTNGFRAHTGVIAQKNDELVKPRAQHYSKFLGQQIKFEINQHKVAREELNTNPTESENLLFYDFNGGSRRWNIGTANVRARDEFAKTGMAGAQFVNHGETGGIEKVIPKRRPITSHFRGGDRLPSRASKTRNRSRRIYIGNRKNHRKQENQPVSSKKTA
jgi:hypothetical protein